MIWDCFMFASELDILDIRLHVLGPHVHKFVLVEATTTHSNKKKPLYYQENKDRFQEFSDKIVHVIVKDMPKNNNWWIPENFQRNCIMRGLEKARPHDLILISDVDEIPRPTKFKEIRNRGISIFSHDYYIYYLNSRSPDEPFWNMGTRTIHRQELVTPQDVRNYGSHRTVVGGKHTIFYGGWHFSYLGGAEAVAKKLANCPDSQLRGVNAAISFSELKKRMGNGTDPLGARGGRVWQPVPIDETYPEYIRENIDKFAHLILKGKYT